MESSNLFSASAASCKLEKLFKADTISPLFFIDFVNSPIFFNCVIGENVEYCIVLIDILIYL